MKLRNRFGTDIFLLRWMGFELLTFAFGHNLLVGDDFAKYNRCIFIQIYGIDIFRKTRPMRDLNPRPSD